MSVDLLNALAISALFVGLFMMAVGVGITDNHERLGPGLVYAGAVLAGCTLLAALTVALIDAWQAVFS